jgi:hypothetical protein
MYVLFLLQVARERNGIFWKQGVSLIFGDSVPGTRADALARRFSNGFDVGPEAVGAVLPFRARAVA